MLQGGLLVTTKGLFLKNRCCSSVQLTPPTVSCNSVSLENIRSLDRGRFLCICIRENCHSFWIHSIRSTFSICVCKHPGKQLLIPVKLSFPPHINHFVHLSTPVFSSLSFSGSLSLQFCFFDQNLLIKLARSLFKFPP